MSLTLSSKMARKVVPKRQGVLESVSILAIISCLEYTYCSLCPCCLWVGLHKLAHLVSRLVCDIGWIAKDHFQGALGHWINNRLPLVPPHLAINVQDCVVGLFFMNHDEAIAQRADIGNAAIQPQGATIRKN